MSEYSQIRDYSFSRAWGVNPACASGVVVVADGSFVDLGVDETYTLAFGSVASLTGILSELTAAVEFGANLLNFQIVDNRVHLGWQTVYGAWNIEDDFGVTDADTGVRKRRYRHLLPENWEKGQWTYTDAPMKTKAILDSAFDGAEGDFTFARLYHSGLNDGILTGLDYSTGIKLSNLISEINGKTGLEVGLTGTNTLVWCRKGEGSLPSVDWSVATPRSQGLAITTADTAIRVVGERIRHQKLNIVLEPDWKPAWNAMIDELAFRRAVAAATSMPNATKADQLLVSAYARKITVAQFAKAKEDASYLDPRRFGKVSRNQLPAWVYIRELVYRSYRIPGSFTLGGVPLASLDLADGLIENTDVAGSAQILAIPAEYYPSCQATAVVRGQPLDLINAQDIREFYKNVGGDDMSSVVTAAPDFEVDAQGKSIRFRTVMFQDGAGGNSIYLRPNRGEGGCENLTAKVDADSDYLKIAVPNPDFVITAAQVKASFCFLLGRYHHDYGSGKRHGSIAASGLDQHLVEGEEVPYEDGDTALVKANAVAASALALSALQASGGFTLHGTAGTPLTPCVDRVTVNINFEAGITEQVEYTKARASGAAFAERTLQRIQRSEEVFSGQENLKREIREYRLMAAAESAPSSAVRSNSHRQISDVFSQPVGSSRVSTSTVPATGGTWKAGDVVWLDAAGAPTDEDGAFGGVVVATPKSGAVEMVLAYSGRVPMKVASGLQVNAPVMGTVGVSSGGSSGAVALGRLAHGEPTPETTSGTVMAMVDLGSGSSSPEGDCPFGQIITWVDGETTKTGIRGGVVYCGDKNFSVADKEIILGTPGVWLIQISLVCEANRDDDDSLILPGIKTSSASTASMSAKTWATGTNYDSNTNPTVSTGIGTIKIPIGKLTVASGVATLEPAGCGNITVDQCAGILSHHRG